MGQFFPSDLSGTEKQSNHMLMTFHGQIAHKLYSGMNMNVFCTVSLMSAQCYRLTRKSILSFGLAVAMRYEYSSKKDHTGSSMGGVVWQFG